jgi:hypothetical protein
MLTCHASLRTSSATICSTTATASTHAAASPSAAANSSRRPGEYEHEDRRRGERADDGDRGAPPATEVPRSGGQRGQPTETGWAPRRVRALAARARHAHAASIPAASIAASSGRSVGAAIIGVDTRRDWRNPRERLGGVRPSGARTQEAAITALLRRLRRPHPRSVGRRQTPRGFRQTVPALPSTVESSLAVLALASRRLCEMREGFVRQLTAADPEGTLKQRSGKKGSI